MLPTAQPGSSRCLPRRVWLIAALVAAGLLAGCSAAGSPPATQTGGGQTSGSRPAHSARVPPRTFVSMVPACACGRRTELELFSLTSGRMLRRLAPVATGGDQVATPAAARGGRVFFTFTSGPRCAYTGNYAECPGFTPNSCRNRIETYSPGQAQLHPLFAVAGSRAVLGAVTPSPDGSRVALTLTPCLALHGTTGLLVRDLSTARTRPILTSSNRCDGFGPAAWSASGRELVFPFDQARGGAIPMAGGIGCPNARNRLAVASAVGAPHVRLIDPPRGCIFRAAAFDRSGILAAAGCNQGDPQHGTSHLGRAYLLQYASPGRLTTRIALRLGLEEAVVAPEPGTGRVLITQDQPANQPYRERDWVYEWDGSRLRLVADYPALDAAQVLAVPW